jgi:hypothetical protein
MHEVADCIQLNGYNRRNTIQRVGLIGETGPNPLKSIASKNYWKAGYDFHDGTGGACKLIFGLLHNFFVQVS